MGLMFVITLSVAIAVTRLDDAFCPLAPSPTGYEDNLGLRVSDDGQLTNRPLGAQVAARLVDVKSEQTVGWLYVDDDSVEHVQLKHDASPVLYRWFGIPIPRIARPEIYAQPEVVRRGLPPGIAVRNCNSITPRS